MLGNPCRAQNNSCVKSSTAGSEHTPHPFYSHLSQSSCVKRRLGHSSSATYGLHSLASNTNPQSSSSYSLRVLSSLHEIFRVPFLIIGLKDCQSSSPARQNSQQKHSRETCFSKKDSYQEKLFPYRSQLSVNCQNRFKRSWDLLLLKENTLLQASTLLLLQHNYLTVSKLPSATNFTHSIPPNNKNSCSLQKQASGQNNMHFATKLQGQSKGLLTFHTPSWPSSFRAAVTKALPSFVG